MSFLVFSIGIKNMCGRGCMICFTQLLNVFFSSKVFSSCLPARTHSYIGRICLFFSSVHHQMRLGGGITTLIAFVFLFSNVCFQMCPQRAGLNGCKILLAAFVCLFSKLLILPNFDPSAAHKYLMVIEST